MARKIVIIGAGQVGFYLAKTLSEEHYDISIIDIDPQKCKRAREHLDAMVIEGHGAQGSVLAEANTAAADLFIAVTRMDEINILACMKARKMNPKVRTIARVRSDDYIGPNNLLDLKAEGIDMIINPERTAALEIQHLVQNAIAQEIMPYADGRLYMLALTPTPESKLMNQSLREIGKMFTELPFRTVVIDRDGQTIIPKGDHVFLEGDKIFVMCKREHLDEMYQICGYRREKKINTVMILGAGKLGRLVAWNLKDDYNVRLVDKEERRLDVASKKLPDVLLLEGDGMDVDFLDSAGIKDIDAFISVTNDETTNLFSGLITKRKGVGKVIVHISSPDYIPLVKGLGINSVVSKNLTSVDAIMRYVLRGRVHSVMMLEGIDTEIIELSPSENSPIVGNALKDMDFPKDAAVGAVIHPEGVEIATGKTIMGPDDRVLVFTRPNKLANVEALFN
ncbi:MAG: Trk system potassium transporter TrkA [Lentisphaeria bacterium]|nr:Trk system potassium transporter TrkA [Candidatus Neomarinimicrobiota bacterium]MCF7842257.1 Trk system potassium transporter TrkA [Lentisphaeria bacterium]